MDQNDDNILKEREFILTSDKKNEYKIKLFITNNELFCINLFIINYFYQKMFNNE